MADEIQSSGGPLLFERFRAHLRSMATNQEVAQDFVDGIRRYRFWWELSLNDVRGRYRRTFLGPWWLVFGNALALGAMAIVWSQLFKMELKEFFPYLVAGYITWLMLATYLTEGCSVFSGGAAVSIQRSIPLPKSIHAFRLVSRSVLLFGHNLAVYVVVALAFDVRISIWMLTFVPALIAVAINGVWISIVLGTFGARYRDVEPLTNALLMFIFLITPIMWRADMLGDRAYIAVFNPFTHLIAVMREPLLGQPPPILSWLVVLGFIVVGFGVAFLLLKHAKHKIIFWL